jgi:hypothetical protein
VAELDGELLRLRQRAQKSFEPVLFASAKIFRQLQEQRAELLVQFGDHRHKLVHDGSGALKSMIVRDETWHARAKAESIGRTSVPGLYGLT